MERTRRWFLRGSVFSGVGLLLGCSDDPGGAGGAGGFGGGVGGAGGGGPMCDDPFAGGEQVGEIGFAEEVQVPFDMPFNEGWDGRLYTDLSTLTREGGRARPCCWLFA